MVTFSCRTAGLFLLLFACRELPARAAGAPGWHWMVTRRSGLLPTGSSAQLSSACGMSGAPLPWLMAQQLLPECPSFLLGDCHADPGVDFGVAQWVTAVP